MEDTRNVIIKHHGAATGAARPKIEFDVSRGQALVITHMHIDHVGRIPWPLAAELNRRYQANAQNVRILVRKH
tara:strand:- start:325 stop:543 length:219 start_codon:yes stop_codon:yes gene_type:complete